ncbi:MAG: penicillin acylase family protein, partial [Betaproteobacteria bacterium]|nr:penicillin acylase family protein [Betaproteobacteria bacterium]
MAFAMLVILVIAAAGGYLHLRQSLPQEEGEVRLPGLAKPVDVLRDAYGVPHISAQSFADAVYALGFVHAQDRLWQMEVNRRTAAGRLAEVFGESALETDRFLRTLGIRRAAEANFKQLDSETRALLETYAAGVNAFLSAKPVLPLEFWMTGVDPEPWTPADTLGWVKMMAWDLGGNWRNELLRLRLSKTLPNARLNELLPPYPGETHPELPELRQFYGSLERDSVRLANGDRPHFSHLQMRKMRSVPIYTAEEGLGSNNWVVAGAKSATGKPLLANDPHLGLTAPAVWYFAHLAAPGVDVI